MVIKKLNHTKLALTLSLITIISFSIYTKFAYLLNYGITEDISMVLTPAKQLLANGNLANSGTTIALRILRDGCSLTNYQAPYWFDYLGPVFYFLPFIILFGSNTVLPFAFGQLFLLLTLIGLLIFFTRKKPLFFNLLLISLFTCTSLDGIFWNAPNSLQFLIFLSIVFFNLRVFINRPYILGLLLGCSFQFRPETLFLIPASFLYYFLIRKNNLKNTFIFIGKTILTMSLVVFCFLLIRNLLGGTSSQDHKLYVLATNVLKPDFGVLFGYEVFSFSDLLTKESLFSFFNKVYIGFTKLLTFKHHFWLRKDIWIYAFLIIMSCFKGLHKKVFAELTFIVFIVFFGILLSFIGCDAPKYYDMHLFMISLFFIKRSEIIFNDFKLKSLKTILTLIILFFSVHNAYGVLQKSKIIKNELAQRQLGEELSKLVPKNARIISRYNQTWTWYANRINHLISDNSTYIDPKLMDIYQPDALLLVDPIKKNAQGTNLGYLKLKYKIQTYDGRMHYLFLR